MVVEAVPPLYTSTGSCVLCVDYKANPSNALALGTEMVVLK